MNRKIIINADDFGMDQEVNNGIKKCINCDIVTSTSVITNMPYFDDAIKFLKKTPQVSVGLHFNFTQGVSLSKIPQTQKSFLFSGLLKTLVLLVLKKQTLKQVETELELQYKKLKSSGIKISHIDSHQHIHLFPPIFKIITKFASKNNIPTVRCCSEKINTFSFFLNNFSNLKQLIIVLGYSIISIRIIDKKLKRRLNVTNLHDINWSNNFDHKKWNITLSKIKPGITEIICHPSDLKSQQSSWSKSRYKTLQFLTRKKTIMSIIKNDIQLSGRT